MTWEEWKKWSKLAVEDPSWSYCSRPDCGACLGDDLKYQRDLLHAFADELVKRLDATNMMLDDKCIVDEIIINLLTEAGVER